MVKVTLVIRTTEVEAHRILLVALISASLSRPVDLLFCMCMCVCFIFKEKINANIFITHTLRSLTPGLHRLE